MKILYVCADLGIPVLGSKGASLHVRSLVAALTRAGHEVVLASPSATRSPWDAPAAHAGTFLHLPPDERVHDAARAVRSLEERTGAHDGVAADVRRMLSSHRMAAELRERFVKAPPDVLYERASLLSTAGAVAAHDLGVPFLVELNAPLADEQATYRASGLPRLAAEAERWVLLQADAVLPVSCVLAEYVRGLGVPAERIRVVPNGVELSTFSPGPSDPAVRERHGLGGGPLLAFVGGLRPWHGVEVLPALLERLAPRHQALRLLLVGDGPMRRSLEEDLAGRGLRDRAVFTGSVPQEEVAALLRETAIALAPYPAPRHAFYFSPLKLFEYMASGTAVVASDCGQISEVLRHDENGLLVPPGDLDALEAACERLLADEGLRRRLAGNAARDARARHGWDESARGVAEAAAAALQARARA